MLNTILWIMKDNMAATGMSVAKGFLEDQIYHVINEFIQAKDHSNANGLTVIDNSFNDQPLPYIYAHIQVNDLTNAKYTTVKNHLVMWVL